MLRTLLLLTLTPLLLASTIRQEASKMGSPFVVTIVHENEAVAKAAAKAAWDEIDRLEDMISSWRSHSQTSAINRAAGIKPVFVSPELFGLIKRSLKVSELTEGAFDITFASAGKLWDYRSGRLPDREAVAEAVKAIDWRNVELDEKAQTVFLKKKGTRIGFGAIGKGYAANRALHVIKQLGVQNALINAGGDLVAMGTREDGHAWEITIANPRHPSQYIAKLNISNQAVVTSGDYERFIKVDGKRYSHILDPRTGWPVEGLISVTILCPDGELADALATSVFVLGRQKGMALVNKLKGVEALIIDANGQHYMSNGLHKSVADSTHTNQPTRQMPPPVFPIKHYGLFRQKTKT